MTILTMLTQFDALLSPAWITLTAITILTLLITLITLTMRTEPVVKDSPGLINSAPVQRPLSFTVCTPLTAAPFTALRISLWLMSASHRVAYGL